MPFSTIQYLLRFQRVDTMIDASTVIQEDLQRLCDYNLQFNRWLLKPIGAWPDSPVRRIDRIFSTMLNVTCQCCILITVLPSILYMILDDDDIEKKLKVVGPLSHWFVGGFNYAALLLSSNEIRFCMRQMENDWRTVNKSRDLQIMLKCAKYGRYVVVLCVAMMQGGVLCFCVAKACTLEVVQVDNQNWTMRLLPCMPYKRLIPVHTSPTNEIFVVLQFVSGFIVNSTAAGAFSFAAVFAAHAYGQLSLLMGWITEFVNQSRNPDGRNDFNRIGVIVDNHLRILTFISHIENIMNKICFTELLKCTLCICMLEYHILMDLANHDFTNVPSFIVVFCSMTFNIFIVCYIGEKLTEQCKNVGETIYMTNWYYLPNENVLDIILIISRSTKVTKITAGKIVHMSFNTFANMMKTAFAYLNILRQTI